MCMNEHSPSFEFLSSHFQSRPFRIVAHIPILPNGCVFQMVPLRLEHPYFGRRDRVWRIRMAGTLIPVIPITLERLPISMSVRRHCITCLSCASWEVWKSHTELWRLSCVTRKIPARWTQHTSLSRLSQCRHLAQHGLYFFGTSCPIYSFWGGISPWALHNELFLTFSVPAR